MLDIGWPELLVIAVITILVVGPHEIPRVLKTIRSIIHKIRNLSHEFTKQIDDVVREADIEDYKKQAMDIADNRASAIDYVNKNIDPDGETKKIMYDNEEYINNQMQDIAKKTNDAVSTSNYDTNTSEIDSDNILENPHIDDLEKENNKDGNQHLT